MSAQPSVQDMPPPGGFPQTIKYERYLPKRGPSGVVLFGGMIAIMAYGWNEYFKSLTEKKELHREHQWMRINIVPLLQAETDRDYVRRAEAYKKREKLIMQDADPDWQPWDLKAPTRGIGKRGVFDLNQAEPVYHTERHVMPKHLFVPGDDGERLKSQWWRGSKMFHNNPRYHEREDFTKEHPRGIQHTPDEIISK
ncbi:hypothetical protein HK097_009045 [Rhizophlyctis rosea]|uniref:NADH dehydrogenase [ubiquinone] 1 alpha subcomplex subunit 13 n=1 Tax=Rhizophlyctis rosea TaxID=64517 RepID=A0AAD5X8B3_9FUNG|nr:hypothetical protein HK097_009045 [Rhizophlyctis rosea]